MCIACQATWTVYFKPSPILSIYYIHRYKGKNWNDIEKLPEIQQLLCFKEELGTGNFQGVDTGHKPLLSTGMSKDTSLERP